MSTEWTVVFSEILANYAMEYAEASGNLAARARILNNCQDDIMKSPSLDTQVIVLPQNLRWVSIHFANFCGCNYA